MAKIELTEQTDFELLKLIKEDKRIFDVIYRRYINAIYKYCYNRLNFDKEVTEDLVSEVFLKALEAIDRVKLERDQTLLPWLYTIARNTVFTYTKKNKRFHKFSLDDDIKIEGAVDPIADIEKNIDRTQQIVEVRQIIDQFDRRDQDIIFLKIEEELTFKEIAEILNLKESTVKMRFYRALGRVTKILENS